MKHLMIIRKTALILIIVLLAAAAVAGVYLPGAKEQPQQTDHWRYKSRHSLFKVLPNPDEPVVFAGASIVEYCEWSELYGQLILNRGIAGDTTADLLFRIDSIAALKPRLLVIMVGLNDLMCARPTQLILQGYQHIMEMVREESPSTRLAFFSLLPIRGNAGCRKKTNQRILQLNKELAQLCRKNDSLFLDIHQHFTDPSGQLREELTHDGVHLNGEGYRLLEKASRPALDQLWAERP